MYSLKDFLKETKDSKRVNDAAAHADKVLAVMTTEDMAALAKRMMLDAWRNARRAHTLELERKASADVVKTAAQERRKKWMTTTPSPKVPTNTDNLQLTNKEQDDLISEFRAKSELHNQWLDCCYYNKSDLKTNDAYMSRQIEYIRNLERSVNRGSVEADIMHRDIRDSEEARVREREIELNLRETLRAATQRFKEATIMEFTNELLNATFSLPDGTEVKWGDATVDQHEARKQMFQDQAQTNLEGAARHDIAIELLRTTGARTLYDYRAQGV